MKRFIFILSLFLLIACQECTDYTCGRSNLQYVDEGIVYLRIFGIRNVSLLYDTIGKSVVLPEKLKIENGYLVMNPNSGFSVPSLDYGEDSAFEKYTLKSWNTKIDGSGDNYKPGTIVKITSEIKMFYAIPYEIAEYTSSDLANAEDAVEQQIGNIVDTSNTSENSNNLIISDSFSINLPIVDSDSVVNYNNYQEKYDYQLDSIVIVVNNNGSTTNVDNQNIDKTNATITKNGKIYNLFGNVKIVNSNEDIKVKIVSTGYDIKIHPGSYNSSCGNVKLVSTGYDYKVRIVTTGEDLKVKIVGSGNAGF